MQIRKAHSGVGYASFTPERFNARSEIPAVENKEHTNFFVKLCLRVYLNRKTQLKSYLHIYFLSCLVFKILNLTYYVDELSKESIHSWSNFQNEKFKQIKTFVVSIQFILPMLQFNNFSQVLGLVFICFSLVNSIQLKHQLLDYCTTVYFFGLFLNIL